MDVRTRSNKHSSIGKPNIPLRGYIPYGFNNGNQVIITNKISQPYKSTTVLNKNATSTGSLLNKKIGHSNQIYI